jgi:hypothetical protein
LPGRCCASVTAGIQKYYFDFKKQQPFTTTFRFCAKNPSTNQQLIIASFEFELDQPILGAFNNRTHLLIPADFNETECWRVVQVKEEDLIKGSVKSFAINDLIKGKLLDLEECCNCAPASPQMQWYLLVRIQPDQQDPQTIQELSARYENIECKGIQFVAADDATLSILGRVRNADIDRLSKDCLNNIEYIRNLYQTHFKDHVAINLLNQWEEIILLIQNDNISRITDCFVLEKTVGNALQAVTNLKTLKSHSSEIRKCLLNLLDYGINWTASWEDPKRILDKIHQKIKRNNPGLLKEVKRISTILLSQHNVNENKILFNRDNKDENFRNLVSCSLSNYSKKQSLFRIKYTQHRDAIGLSFFSLLEGLDYINLQNGFNINKLYLDALGCIKADLPGRREPDIISLIVNDIISAEKFLSQIYDSIEVIEIPHIKKRFGEFVIKTAQCAISQSDIVLKQGEYGLWKLFEKALPEIGEECSEAQRVFLTALINRLLAWAGPSRVSQLKDIQRNPFKGTPFELDAPSSAKLCRLTWVYMSRPNHRQLFEHCVASIDWLLSAYHLDNRQFTQP